MTQHYPKPIAPPPELVQQWLELSPALAIAAAFQAGADQELEACCKELEYNFMPDSSSLRAARRPKPPSLKEQALLALSHLVKGADESMDTTEAAEYIRRALEALPDD